MVNSVLLVHALFRSSHYVLGINKRTVQRNVVCLCVCVCVCVCVSTWNAMWLSNSVELSNVGFSLSVVSTVFSGFYLIILLAIVVRVLLTVTSHWKVDCTFELQLYFLMLHIHTKYLCMQF